MIVASGFLWCKGRQLQSSWRPSVCKIQEHSSPPSPWWFPSPYCSQLSFIFPSCRNFLLSFEAAGVHLETCVSLILTLSTIPFMCLLLGILCPLVNNSMEDAHSSTYRAGVIPDAAGQSCKVGGLRVHWAAGSHLSQGRDETKGCGNSLSSLRHFLSVV